MLAILLFSISVLYKQTHAFERCSVSITARCRVNSLPMLVEPEESSRRAFPLQTVAPAPRGRTTANAPSSSHAHLPTRRYLRSTCLKVTTQISRLTKTKSTGCGSAGRATPNTLHSFTILTTPPPLLPRLCDLSSGLFHCFFISLYNLVSRHSQQKRPPICLHVQKGASHTPPFPPHSLTCLLPTEDLQIQRS